MAQKTETWSPAPVTGIGTVPPSPAAPATSSPVPAVPRSVSDVTSPNPPSTESLTTSPGMPAPHLPSATGPANATQEWSPSLASEERPMAPSPRPTGAVAAIGESTGRSSGDIVGTQLKHFRIDQRIAAGGMGEVFLGFDTSLSRPVAIKTIRTELARDGDFLARFVREATAQANVVHPHVVQVYFVGEDRGVWFLAMQIVDGGSLHQVLESRKKMRWQDAARHMTAICEGLVVAERHNIVHRDIKPANILMDREGRALLSDFGLAASAGVTDAGSAPVAPRAPSGSQLQLASVTQVGVVMGTPEYVAPEQLRVGPLDARADMYALAATFFHLMSGVAVMPVQSLPEAIAKYGAGQRAPLLHSVRPNIPRAFADVIDRCLSPVPEKRFANMGELLVALRRAGAQPEVPASPILRALVWLLDVAPLLAIGLWSSERMPWLAPLLFIVAGAASTAGVGSTPGIWMMRLRLRTTIDGDVSFARGFARFLVQHGWYVPLAIGWYALHASSDLDVLLLVGLAWLGVSVVGSLGALVGRHQTLHDLVTKTRLLVDVRYR